MPTPDRDDGTPGADEADGADPEEPRHSTSLWRQRPLLLLTAARLCSQIAVQMQTVAVGWLVYDLTRSAVALGLIGLAQFLPLMMLALIAGHAADHLPRRALLVLCYAVEFAATLGIGTAAAFGVRDPWPIYALVVLFAAARAFEAPTTRALLPSLVPPRLLSRAIAGNTSANQTATILGPALGGLLYGIGSVVVFAACAAALVGATILVVLLPRGAPRSGGSVLDLGGVFAGISFIRRQPIVFGAISLDLFAVLLGGATALLPIYARDILHAGPLGLGLLRSAPAIGAFATALVLARHPIKRRAGHLMFAMVAAFGLATIVFGLSRRIELSVAALVALGATDVVSMVIRQTLVQVMTPDALRGRVSAVASLFTGTSNQLGEFRAGLMAAWLGPVAAVVLGGLGTLAIVAVGIRLFPALRRAERLEPERRGVPVPHPDSPARELTLAVDLPKFRGARASRIQPTDLPTEALGATSPRQPDATDGCHG